MNRVFADTSFYIAFSNPRDAWYDAGLRYWFVLRCFLVRC